MNYQAVLFFLFFTQIAFAQPDTSAFPAAWVGIWTGDLEIYNAQGKAQTVPMELHILPIDTSGNYTWTIIYGADKEAGKRPYELVIIDAATGHYAIDEKNSIILDAYLLGGKLFQRFSVMGNMLIATNEMQGDEMIYEIFSGKEAPVSTTGGTTIEEEEIPEVQAFPITVRQKAVLKRQN